jgi:hypothetical protein
MRGSAGLIPVATLFLSFGLRAADRQTSAQLFEVYAEVVSIGPISKAEFETLKPDLQKDGFSTSDGIHWQMGDASGRVLFTTLPDSGLFSVVYFPIPPSASGDSALAALIGKAEKVEVDEGDVIVITLGTKSLSNGPRTGTRTERLKFNLRGGMWQETDVDVNWR